MPTCPNCGSWVDEGDSICSCGASVGGFSSGTENFENEISCMRKSSMRLMEEILMTVGTHGFLGLKQRRNWKN